MFRHPLPAACAAVLLILAVVAASTAVAAGDVGQKISWKQSRMCPNCTADPTYLCGRVHSVHDGDSIRIVPAATAAAESRQRRRSVRVRLLQVDAPELRQAHGPEARDALARLLPAGSRVCVVSPGRDRYRRVLGFVCARRTGQRDCLDVNAWLLAGGHAWCYRGRCCPAYKAAAQAARAAGRGLWNAAAEQQPVQPWIFRRRQRRQRRHQHQHRQHHGGSH